ncbi:aspartyl protease family protein [Myroides odoratimimus]|uniref:PDZ domain-containing protein n=1 Tax=Myroides odoratimimus TaxID=76832 RepID=UPI002DBA83BE|nr:aspartyl protease family protein [Myroides odoratimimus]MEC4051885.1 aspartyl protease family protein [Myroides odoratimimus]
MFFNNKTNITTVLVLLFSFNLFAQKGIFKKGIITPSIYNEILNYTLKEDHIYVDVIIENKIYKFIVDTGAPTSITFNVKGDFKFIYEDELHDASNNVSKVKYVSIPSIKIGNLEYKNFTAVQSDMDAFKTLGVDGLIGGNMISKSCWDFDLENNRITLSNTLDKKEISSFNKVKVKKEDTGTPTLTMSYFNGLKEKNIFFDTGYNDFFYLSEDVFNTLNDKKVFSKALTGEGVISYSAFGPSIGKTYIAPLEIKVGNYEIPVFLTAVDVDDTSNLGSKWLQYYRTILYKNHFYFKPYNKSFSQTYENIGIKTKLKNNELVISFVWDSPAIRKNNLKIDDKILSVNDREISAMSKEELKEVQRNAFKADKVKIEVNTKGNFIELNKETILSI